jgi:hypothetical protein
MLPFRIRLTSASVGQVLAGTCLPVSEPGQVSRKLTAHGLVIGPLRRRNFALHHAFPSPLQLQMWRRHKNRGEVETFYGS